MIIKDSMEKIKQFINETALSEKGKDILIVMIVILMGLGCFELGRLSEENNPASSPPAIENQPANAVSSINTDINDTATPISQKNLNSVSVGKNFFASSRGSKYYSLGCSGGKTIKPENKVYFSTGKEAETAGYTLSSSCN